jgi:xanthine dehydrogenase accessory factor
MGHAGETTVDAMLALTDRWQAFDDHVLGFALEAAERGERFVLVTLVRIEGSSPRYAGAQMVVSESGAWAGYLSGGCIERAVVAEALDALQMGAGRRVRYGKGSSYFDIQLPCGSAIELHFDVDPPVEALKTIEERLARRQQASLHFREKNAADERILTRRYFPRLRLVVFGVGVAAVQLCRLAELMDVEVELLSPDETTRDFARLGSARVVPLTRMSTLPEFAADTRTAIVFMFHDHDWESQALIAALSTDAFYIGAMGSRASHVSRLENLRKCGVEEQNLARIHAPIGLFPGSKNAGEIALSVLAEIVGKDPLRALSDDGLLSVVPAAELQASNEHGPPTRLGVFG